MILRADSGYGAVDNIEKLMSIKGLRFIVKDYSSREAANVAKDIPMDSYEQDDEAAWDYELPKSNNGLRIILVQVLGSKGELTYTLLHININEVKLPVTEAFHFYNGRQTIEAFFKAAKYTYGIRSFRTSKFYGIYSFLRLVFIAHNLIVWFKDAKLKDSELFNSGVKALVKKCFHVKGFVIRTAQCINIMLEPLSKLAKLLLEALSELDYVQLCFL